MHEPTITLGEVVSVLFENFVLTFRDEELAAHATAVTVGRWFFRRSPADREAKATHLGGVHEIEA